MAASKTDATLRRPLRTFRRLCTMWWLVALGAFSQRCSTHRDCHCSVSDPYPRCRKLQNVGEVHGSMGYSPT